MFQRYVLKDAIFSSKAYPYFLYRMRFFLPVAIVALATNILELFLVKISFGPVLIREIVFMRLVIGLTAGGWWGACTMLREFVRGRYTFEDRDAIEQTTGNWLALSLLMATVVVAVTMNYFFHQRILFDPNERTVFELYILGFTFNAFIDFWLDTYRSGAFAIKRIYRPLRWVIGPGLISFGLFLFFWKTFGNIGLPIAFILGTWIDAAIRAYYIHQTYRSLHLKPSYFPTWQQFRQFFQNLSKKNALLSYLAGISLNIETLLFILFFSAIKQETNFILYLFILRQIYHACSHWGVMFFYFDFRKLQMEAYPPFAKTFIKKLLPLSFLISLIFYSLTIPVTYFFYPSQIGSIALLTFVFFLLISIYSYIEIHAFSENRFADLILSSLVVTAIFLTTDSFAHSLAGITFSFLASFILIVLFLWKKRFPSSDTIDSVKKHSLYTLFYHLIECKKGFQVLRVKTDPHKGRKTLNAFLSQTSLLMDQKGWICPISTNEFFFIETQNRKQLNGPLLLSMEKDHHDSANEVGQIVQHCFAEQTPDRKGCLNIVFHAIGKEIKENRFYQLHKNIPLEKLFTTHFPQELIMDLNQSRCLFDHPDKEKIYASIEASFLTPLALLSSIPYASSILFDSRPLLFLIKKEGHDFKKVYDWVKFIHFTNFNRYVT